VLKYFYRISRAVAAYWLRHLQLRLVLL